MYEARRNRQRRRWRKASQRHGKWDRFVYTERHHYHTTLADSVTWGNRRHARAAHV